MQDTSTHAMNGVIHLNRLEQMLQAATSICHESKRRGERYFQALYAVLQRAVGQKHAPILAWFS